MQNSKATVIVPVYRDKAGVEACIASVLQYSAGLDRLIIINDCSPDPDLEAFCDEIAGHPLVELITNPSNEGFVASVNRGVAAALGDVVLLNSDTVVSQGWLDRILATASRFPDAATISPFTNNGTICSYPQFCEPNELPEGISLSALCDLFARVNDGETCELPTAVGFCMYIRRTVLDEVGIFDVTAFGRGYGEENDFCMKASAAGWRHLLAADVFVYHEGSVSFGKDAALLQQEAMKVLDKRYPEYRKIIADHVAADPAQVFRANVDRERLCIEGQPVVIFSEMQHRVAQAQQQLRDVREVHEEEARKLTSELTKARAHAAEQSTQLSKVTEEIQSLGLYADNRAAEAASYAQRIQQLEQLTASMAHESAGMVERIEKYDERIEEYETLLSSARGDFQRVDEAQRQLEEEKLALKQQVDRYESMTIVKIWQKTMGFLEGK